MKVAHLTTVDMSLRFLVMPQLVSAMEGGADVLGISAPGEYVTELEDAGVRHVALAASTRAMNPVADLRSALHLWRILRHERPDVLHTHNPKPGVYGRVVGRLAGVPVVVNTVHGLYAAPDDSLAKKTSVYSLEAIASRFSDAELVQNREDLELIRRLRLAPRDRLRLLGNGVDLNRFDPSRFGDEERRETRAELGVGWHEVLFGTVGRLVAEKGYPELFTAQEKAARRHPLVCVGPFDPDKNDALTTETVDTAAANGVIFTGMRRDVDRLYAAFDVFVLPSHREGFPRAAMEAAAMGLPIIATDIRGCREVVEHGVNGLLVPPRDPEALADAMERLAGDETLRRAMSKAARERALERFDERAVVEIVMKTYRDVSRRKGLDLYSDARPAEVTLRRATREDVPALAGLHSQAIDTGFLPRLGPRFMRVLYRALVSAPDAEVVVADDGDGVVGFVAGVTSTPGFYRWFAPRWGLMALLAALPRLLYPSFLRRAWDTVRYGRGEVHDAVEAELLSMAVVPSARGRGVATELGRRFLEGMESRGVAGVKVVVGAGNESAIAVYRRIGFGDGRPVEVHPDEPSLELRWSG